MPKVLITGGAGFIGSAIAKYFANKGFDVKTFDIKAPILPVGEHNMGSIMYPNEIDLAVKGCDYAIHLAALLGVKRTEIKRMDCLNINIQGTKNVIDACVRARVKKIIFSSSSEVYGEPVKSPISETDPVSPKSVYAITKLASEEYLKAYKSIHDINYSVVRFFNIYGPGQVAEFVIPRFIKAVMENKAPLIYGKGDQVRSFCHVNDAAQGVYKVLISDKSDSEIFNIGNDRTSVSMEELARKIIRLSGKKIEPTFVKIENSDRSNEREIIHRIPDITKAKGILNYNPTIGLEEGILDVMKCGKIEETWFDPMHN